MASTITSLSISTPSGTAHQLGSSRSSSFAPTLPIRTKPQLVRRFRQANLSVRSDYHDGDKGGSSDFVAGFVLGGAVFGTLAYVFAPQIRRAVLNEDEYGFRRARRPIYYDEGLENTRQTLNAKIRQLNSAIDNVSSRLRGGNKTPPIPIEETDPEMEESM